MAVLVGDHAVVEVAVARGRRSVAQVNIRMRGRCPSGGVAKLALQLPAACARDMDVVVAEAAVAVVVDLEVAARLVEAVLVEHVVDDVVPVEEVRHRGRPVGAGRSGQVDGEVAQQARAAIGLGARRGRRVVAVAVLPGVGVVAAVDGELGTGDTVGVVPAEGRGHGVLGIDEQRSGRRPAAAES